MGREQNVNWKLTSEFISQQSLAKTVILISRDSSKVVLKRKDRVFFKYLFNVNGLGSPKMTFSAGMWSFRGKAAWVTGCIKVRVQWMDYCRLCEQARYLHSSAHCWGPSPPFNYIKAAGATGCWGLQITLIAWSLSLISCFFSSSNFCTTSWSCLSAASRCWLLCSFREEMVVWSSAMI